MTLAVAEAAATLRAEGHDVETTASLLLNGAAALVLERCTQEEFGELARRMWRAAARQVELVSLLDRITERRGLGVRPKTAARAGGREPSPCPPGRTLRQGETS